MKKSAEKLNRQLYGVIASLKTEKEVKLFFEDLCTNKELENMATRVECAKLLTESCTFRDITAAVDVSTATLSRVNRCIQYGPGGYRNALKKYFGE